MWYNEKSHDWNICQCGLCDCDLSYKFLTQVPVTFATSHASADKIKDIVSSQ